MKVVEQGCLQKSLASLFSSCGTAEVLLGQAPQVMVPGFTSSPPRSILSEHSNSPAALLVMSNVGQEVGGQGTFHGVQHAGGLHLEQTLRVTHWPVCQLMLYNCP